MSFKLENFVAAPSMELLNLAKKTDLLNIADHYALTSVKPSMLKHEIKNILIKFLVDEEILDPSALSSILVTQTDLQLRELEVQRQIQLEKLRLEQEERIRVEQLEREERKLEREERMQKEKLAMEKEKLEMEERIQKEKLEQAEKEKERQYNLRMKELEMQDKAKTKPLDLGTHFDVTKHIRLVPPFQEKEDGNGVDHPVSYFSKKFNKHQKNYSTIEKECLSLILALQHFEVYLTSSPSPIVVFSDHNPLIFIHKMKNKNQRLLRWSLLLQEYNLDIRHIKGKDNIISDALSRA